LGNRAGRINAIARLGGILTLLVVLSGCGLLNAFTVPAPDSLTGEACFLTPPDARGPYYIANAPVKESLYPEGTPGERLVISGTVYTAGCVAVLAGAEVDVWQADANGDYDFSDQFLGRGKVLTDANGRYRFETILPGLYEPRPRHIHFRVYRPDASELITQLYFEGSVRGAPDALTIPLTRDGDVLRGQFDIILGP
jgi:protocatechuate 3,4-dioxygenase beta subunit